MSVEIGHVGPKAACIEVAGMNELWRLGIASISQGESCFHSS
jgi:hypothetical protein